MKNHTAKLIAVGKVEIFEEDIPKLQNGELLIAIKSAGICGSDRHYFLHGGLGSFKQPLPMYMGHEAAGIVIDANNSKIFKKDDRVAIEPSRHCGKCELCSRGRFNLCTNSIFMGANTVGAFSEYVSVHETQIEKIPDSMTFETATLLEPLGIAAHAFNLKRPSPSESATIFGCGPIGLSILYILKKIGVKEIYMIDKLRYRTNFALQTGAKKTFTIEENYIKEIKGLTNGRGTDLNIDAAGEESSINGCIQTAASGGFVYLIGIPETDYVLFNPHKMRIKELTLLNVRRSNQTLKNCIQTVGEDQTLLKMASHKYPLDEIQKAFETVANYSGGVIKCMITPSVP